ncbi:uncharacterized protein LOC127740479 [Arachis duranensis]|uniref:Uncharacterized protein LOC127740479 n=1 Tax=Arachis duranensis TaxID=130453 RepID=A0A9C6T088_ARADU|nr:uncharacterized protein LOC127740479 [Arachis duranensis]
MNILAWNCRGVSSKGFPIMIRDLTYRYNLKLCILLETHVSGTKVEGIIRKLGFDSWCISDAEGFSGGIWCLWNGKDWQVEPVNVQRQLIHLKIKDNDNRSWYFTCIYGSPQPGTRSTLWRELESIAATNQGPWCLGGDFNSIISLEETGGNRNLSQDSNRFQECMLNCGLNDLGFSGPPFTWQRNQIKPRLDRFLCNLEFNVLFPSVGVKHLPKLKSDHLPILLDFDTFAVNGRERPFKLLASWLLHEGYNNLVRSNWYKQGDLINNIHHFTEKAKEWNKEVFGQIFRKKKRILLRLEGINQNLSFNNNPFLEKLQRDLWREYEMIVVQEESYWMQMAKCKIINLGDKNSKYFHQKANGRRRRNHVNALKNSEDEWIDNVDELKEIGVSFFKSLYAPNNYNLFLPDFPITGKFPRLIEADLNHLSRNITHEEVKHAVFNMGSWKAPGSDGLPAKFFQHS